MELIDSSGQPGQWAPQVHPARGPASLPTLRLSTPTSPCVSGSGSPNLDG